MAEHNSEADPRLALPREEMRRFGYEVIDLLVDHFEKIGDQPVGAKLDAKNVARFHQEEGPPEHGCNPSELIAHLVRDVFPNNLHLDHPRFFAFVPSPGNFVSTYASPTIPGQTGPAAARSVSASRDTLPRICFL